MKPLKWIWALALAALGFFLGTRQSKTACEKKAQDARKETEDKIETTPAGDLVNDAPDADDLRRTKERLKSKLKRELRDIMERNLPDDRPSSSAKSGGRD